MPPKHKGFNMRTKSGSSANPHRSTDNIRQKGGTLRDKATINRLNMYKAKGIRDKKGKLVGGAFMMKNRAGNQSITAETGRVAPDRRWFGNTRVIKQEELDKFREEMSTRTNDPYSVVLRRKKLPMGLLQEPDKVSRMNLLETESYSDVVAKGRRRKRPKLASGVTDLSSLIATAERERKTYGEGEGDSNMSKKWEENDVSRAKLFDKGQSKRIWAELYKVLDCSDVVIQVLDARNVPGTRCPHLEKHLKKNASHKHLIFVINKVDLVPTWVTKKWVKLLSATHPTLAFHASITNSFGKGALINLLRQFAKLHPDKKQISVGVVGYPNVGKSSIINTLKKKKVCKVAPVPGETKVWQYITLMRRIFIIDCPGVVYDDGDDETEIVLKGVVRAEKLPEPSDFVPAILSRVKEEYVRRLYGVSAWEDATDFMTKVAARSGRLLPGGEPDFHAVSVNLINDYQRGKLPYFVAPPLAEGETPKSVAAEPTVKASFDAQVVGTAGDATRAVLGSDMDLEANRQAGKGKKSGKRTRNEEDAEDLAAIEAEEAERLARFEVAESDSDETGDSAEEGEEVRSSGNSTVATGHVGDREGPEGSRSKKRKAAPACVRTVEEENNDGEGAGVRKKAKAVTVAGNKGREEERTRKLKRRAEDLEGDEGAGRKKKGRGEEREAEIVQSSGAKGGQEGEEMKQCSEEGDDEDDEDEGGDVAEHGDVMPSIGEGLEWDDLS